jgi:hypothetical protein
MPQCGIDKRGAGDGQRVPMQDGLARRALRVLWIGFAAASFVATPS